MFSHDHPDRHPHHPPRPTVAPEAEFQDLESRTLMSAGIEHPALEAAAPKPAAVVVGVSAHVSAEPKVTDPGITYRNFADDPLFGPAGPTETDVGQGELGDCYLLATLSSVAKTDPALIEKDVVADGNGTYTVDFAGARKAVTVDAELPTFADGQVAYAQLGVGNSLWVAVVEKAYATFKGLKAGGYAAISGGWMGDVFTAFGLKNQSVITTPTAAALGTTLRKDLAAGDFVTYGTIDGLPTQGTLVGGHAYSVESVATDGHGNVKTITLRNPWGTRLGNGTEFVTVTAQQAYDDFGGVVVGHA